MKKIFYILSAALFIGCSAPTPKGAQIEVLGHRGGRYETDENTLSAFVESYNNGVRSYETDIRMTADNELVISHDASLKRTFGVDVDVEKSNRADLAQYKSLKGNPVLFADELAKFYGESEIRYIEWEMKSGNYTPEQLELYCDKLYNTTMSQKPADAIYVFSSFDERAIMTMRRLHPDAEIMYLTGSPMSAELIEKLKSMDVSRVGATINGTTRESMQNAHKEGIRVNLWPGSCVEDFQLALALGADIACTDIPVAVLEFVKNHMEWVTPRNDLK